LESNTLVYRLHAVDITTGLPRTGSGVVITGSYSTMTFDARNAWQRIALVLSGNNVVFGFGALELESTANLYSGWVMAYDKGTLTQTGIFATVTSGNGGAGVWQSGRPPAVDTSGNVYVITGNGYNGTGYDGVHNFSESILKLDPAAGLALKDWFTPSSWLTLDNQDLDLTSSGPMLVPGTSLLVGGGKTGVLYVLNTAGTGLGKETANDSGALQAVPISVDELRGGPVYWQRSSANGGPLLYNWGVNDRVKSFAFNGTTLATTPSAQGSVTSQIWPGGFLTLSANSDTPGSGVLWATVTLGGAAATSVVVVSATQITANTPAHAQGSVNVLVTNPDGQSTTLAGGFTFGTSAPTLTGVSPTTGLTAGGTSVTLTGTNFASGATLTFGGAAATSVVVVSTTQITAKAPPHKPGAVNIVVTNPNGQSGTLSSSFTYHKH
jgi:hypothetical protein